MVTIALEFYFSICRSRYGGTQYPPGNGHRSIFTRGSYLLQCYYEETTQSTLLIASNSAVSIDSSRTNLHFSHSVYDIYVSHSIITNLSCEI